MDNVVIETPRFVLRSLIEGDATERYLDWMINTVSNRFIVSARSGLTLADLRVFIAECRVREDVLFLGIFLRDDGSHIGNIKYDPIRQLEGYAVMGMLIGEGTWRGQGVAREVINASIRWLEAKFGLREILLGVDRENEAAISAYRKFGFHPDQSDRVRISSSQSMSMVYKLGASQ